jgi:hypothetical protein
MNRNSVLTLAALCILLVSNLCAQIAPKPLSNDDVIAMVKGGLGENTIIGAIQSQQSSFDISAMGLLHLKSSGVNPKIMDAMLTAARRKPAPEEPAATPQAAAPMPPPLDSGLPLVTMGAGKVLPAGHAQVVQTKAKASTLNALAADGALSQTLNSVTQGLATAGMMHPGSAMAPTAMMAMPMVGPALMGASLFSQHHKPTVTEVWALPGQKAETSLTNNQPSFEVHFANVPGVNPDEYEPVLLKLEPTTNNFRLVGATQAKQDAMESATADWGLYASFVEERLAINSKKVASGEYQLQTPQPLSAGQYGIALRPLNKDKKYSGAGMAQNVGDGLIFSTVWSFEMAQ